MNLYNLFPLLAGPLNRWKPHLERAADLGFDWIFVNPIQQPGRSGSLYSVKDYFRLHPLMFDEQDSSDPASALRAVIHEFNTSGMKFMVDLVVSHCAIDSPLIQDHPSWFKREDGRIAHPFCYDGGRKVVWEDLAKFDHTGTTDQEGLYLFLVEIVDFLLNLGFEGFRCDAAYQVPTPLWRRLIQETKSHHPNTVFCAETLGCSPRQTIQVAGAGFDYVFNSAKWWDFHSPWLMEQYTLTRETTRSISFPESHDTPRLFEESHGKVAQLKQRYFFAAFFSAGVMIPIGFEFGFRGRLDVVKTRPEHWEPARVDLTRFIREINHAKSAYSVFQEDSPTELLATENPNILFLWKGSPTAQEEALLILNKDTERKQHFYLENLYHYVQSKHPLRDISPEYRLDYLPAPFEYDLRPGQGMLFLSQGPQDPVQAPPPRP